MKNRVQIMEENMLLDREVFNLIFDSHPYVPVILFTLFSFVLVFKSIRSVYSLHIVTQTYYYYTND